MAGKKISELTALGTTFAATDLFEISKDDGGGTYVSRKITGAEISSSISTSIAIGDTITSATAGSVLFAGAAGVLAQDNANFFWDDTNNRLGIGTASPSFTLHVLSAAADLDTKIESNGGHSRFIIDSTGADDSILQFNEANARRWSIYTDGTDDSLKITRSDVPTASPTSDAIAIDSTDNVSIPNGTLTINDYTFPAADGGANQVLQTDGAGALSFAAASGGATDLNGLTDVEAVAGSSALAFSLFFSNGTSPGGTPSHGTLSSASRNFAVLANALGSLTSGDSNIAIGYYAGASLTTESFNVLIGDSAGKMLNGGANACTAIGYAALDAATTGYGNTAIGYNAASAVTLGDFNVCIGAQTGDGLQNADRNIIIGYDSDGAANADHQIVIGDNIDGTQASSFVLGQDGQILLHGDFATAGQTKLGINLGNTFSAPTATLHVKGQGTGTDVALLVEDSGGTDIIKALMME